MPPAPSCRRSRNLAERGSYDRINLVKGKYKWAIITDDKGRDNHDIPAGEHRLIDLGAPPFEVKGLLDLPIKFGGDTGKVAQLLDLSRR